ncbi:MAG: carbon-nitrogen hydrolase family protein [Desulfobacterales bacterium]|nr:carbon-nitrogen hydrolase family protein [Desulfobacterales bacterium]
MKVAIYQGQGKLAQVHANLEIIRQAAFSAVKQGAELILFPEMFLTGYNIGEAVFDLAEPTDGPAAQKASAIAREANIALLYGYPEKFETHTYNSAILIDQYGSTLASYRKTHLYGNFENRCFQPGDSLMLAKLNGLTIGILICYDVEFPEAVRALTMAGADFIAVPTALMKPYCQIANHVVPARAYENEIYVAYVNRCGVEGRLEYCGLSCIIGPDGSEIIRAGSQEALLIADIDKLKIEEMRKKNPVLGDRRPEVYDKLVKVFSGS